MFVPYLEARTIAGERRLGTLDDGELRVLRWEPLRERWKVPERQLGRHDPGCALAGPPNDLG